VSLTLSGRTPFRGFLVTPAPSSPPSAPSALLTFPAPLPAGARAACGGVGHASPALKAALALRVALPAAAAAAGSAPPADVALRYYVLVSAAEWYGPLTATLRVGGGGGGGAVNGTHAAPLR
jgi:hypothetical protein